MPGRKNYKTFETATTKPQSMSAFKNDVLNTHNTYRKLHSAPALKWSNKLYKNAQKWADQLAKKGYLQHENQNEEGENIASMKGAELTGEKATTMWYDEVKDYDYNKATFNSKTGHFTQVVWIGSTEIGVARATASNGMQFVVARYNPPGNVIGRFPQNVIRANGKPPPRSNNNNNANNSNNNRNAGGNNSNNNRSKPTTNSNNPDQVNNERQNTKNFRSNLMKTHNRFRKRHGNAPLKWSSELASMAQTAAEEASVTNTLRSINNNQVGQNMAAMVGSELTGEKVSTMWYEEEKSYDYNNARFSSNTGSFTQLVWKGSNEVGVGRAFGSQGQTYVVALYKPAGNIRGHYEENVPRPTGPYPSNEKDDQGCQCTIL